MKLQHIAMATAAAAMASSLALAAPTGEQPDAVQVVPGESIYVIPPSATLHGVYITEADAFLLGDAMKAIENDRMTRDVILTIVASNGQLTVNGTADVAQATRIETKLRALHGGTRVFAWFDASSGDGSSGG